MRAFSVSTLIFVCLPYLAACGSGEGDGPSPPGGEADTAILQEDVAGAAVAVLHPTRGNEASGTVRFTPVDGGVRVDSEVAGLTEGRHGYHVHLYGDCTAGDGTSAGTHFNFRGPSRNPPGNIDRITGNLGELVADARGNASHSTEVEHASLTGPKAIVGRSVVVHASANDPDQPPIGAAGSRVACGVIGIAELKAAGQGTGG